MWRVGKQNQKGMMNRGLMIAAIDVLTLVLVVSLLGFFAIRYGSKGSGEKSWVKIEASLPDDAAFLHNPPKTTMHAIIIRGNRIELWPLIGRKIKEEGKLTAVQDNPNSRSLPG